MNKQKALELIEELKQFIQKDESIVLEDNNFKVFSKGWKRVGDVL